MSVKNPSISIVVPLFNEAPVFGELIKRIDAVVKSLPDLTIEVILVDDGSTDGTTQKIQDIAEHKTEYVGLILSRNFGHQTALSAGLSAITASDYVMVIDGDLQDPPEMLHDFLRKSKEGFEIVYGVRKKRKESIFKKLAYWSYYRLISGVSSIDVPLDSGDFCLMSRNAVNWINQMPEKDRYIRGMRTWIGFSQIGIEYERPERLMGETKYSWALLFKLAFSGLFNFSRKPIQFITKIGVSALIIAALYLAHTLYAKYILGSTPSGFTAIIALVVGFSSIQLIALGIIGEYVYRSFELAQNRPTFIVKEVIGKSDSI